MKSPGLGARLRSLLASIDVDDVVGKSGNRRKSARLIVAARHAGRGRGGDPRRRTVRRRPASDQPVAVRSSATAEDMPDASFAGQQDTYLWVVGADDVVNKSGRAGRACSTRAPSPTARRSGIEAVGVEMAVGVQKMVDAAAAGVAMTLEPINGDRTKIVIDCGLRPRRTGGVRRNHAG